MTKPVKIIIPDARPIETLAAAGLLDLLLALPNSEVWVIQSVLNETLIRAPEFREFFERNSMRIKTICTSICKDDADRITRGELIGKGRGDLAIADFILNFIDDFIGNTPALVIFEDYKPGRLREVDQFSENAHFITTVDYLRKLEVEAVITSFDEVWSLIVKTNRA
jgi:hypothetical protein